MGAGSPPLFPTFTLYKGHSTEYVFTEGVFTVTVSNPLQLKKSDLKLNILRYRFIQIVQGVTYILLLIAPDILEMRSGESSGMGAPIAPRLLLNKSTESSSRAFR
ncbi:UNVERIFIED_CONTAM: hypothetical protein PYX00_006206 [Menopon gallinae]|uniref:Uncharacterized protein n=1 Tax=Menopon gallinae TaxID=328185 RepID=A0AAW2HUC4_9NEOP